ncbi:hypothetical protein CWB99_19205 [Pseudoalteromonas rubra]|uniref:Uncharacterized protein n=1 Tax=Pseudoalteromonas rubra TaxID=43658 RepID=A0A5S3WH15_9GAMM|nr:hypothetical protein [Pseudoalteromonas rubra]TMP26433.1 hypothetical protein CWB99_19205 [Pseudoalteromonas rubra]TMP29726.1 hypothetical protein CWC00_18755 [Pseudoalteromonas rubra]
MTYLLRWIASIALLTLAVLTLTKGQWVNFGLLATLGVLIFPRRSQTHTDINAGYGRKLYHKHLVAESNERSTPTLYLIVGVSLVLIVVLYRLLANSPV